MAETKGIQETIDLFEFGISLKNSVELAKADDGKVDVKKEFLFFIDPLTKLPKAVDGIGEVPGELIDIDDEELDVLRARFGDVVDDEDYQDLFRGTLIQARAIRNLLDKKKAVKA